MPLIGWWKLDGDAYDSSPSRNNGTNTGVTYSTESILKQASIFTGNSTYIDITQIDITTHHTMCFWMYGNTGYNGDGYDSVLAGDSSDSINYIASGHANFFAVDDGTYRGWTSDIDFYHKWRHVSLVFNTSTIELFLDGETQGTNSYDGTFSLNCIGRGINSAGVSDYNGYLNDFRVYDHKLSIKEIKEVARAKVLHVTFDTDTFESKDEFYNYQYNSLISSPTLDTSNNKTGTGCLDISSSTSSSVSYGDLHILNPTCSIAFWVYCNNITVRSNPWGKAYGGEGAWTIETGGNISFYWGTSGINGGTYTTGASAPTGTIVAGEWIHIVAVRDFTDSSNKHTKWYKNGEYLETDNYTGTYIPTKGTLPLLIGAGYTTGMTGLLDDFRIYHSVLSAEDVKEIHQTGAQLDNKGNFHTRGMVEGGHEQGTSNSLLDYTIWNEGTTAPSGYNCYYAGEYTFEYGDDPWGRNTLLFKSYGTNGSHDGSFYTNYETIDITKLYRFSLWIKRTILGTSAYIYFGTNGLGATVDTLSGATDGNPYFTQIATNATNTPEGEWMMIVGHIFPHDTSETTEHLESGRYYPHTNTFVASDGGGNNEDYKWNISTTSARLRYLHYENTSVPYSEAVACYPRIDLCDGTEPSVNDLLSGNFYDPNYDNSFNNIGRNGLTVSSNFSEIGPTDELIGYWPLNGNTLDYSGNENTGTASGATVISGFAPRDKYCYEFLTSASKIELNDIVSCEGNEAWSWSFWGYKTTYVSHGIAGHQDAYNGNPGGRLSFTAANNMTVYFRTSGSLSMPLTSSFPISQWFHCTITHTSGGIFKVYLNGIDITSGSPTNAGSIDVNRIGDNPDNSGWISFTGHMMDFRIYNKVLTTQEINILSKMFDTDATNRTEMKMSKSGIYTFGEFKE